MEEIKSAHKSTSKKVLSLDPSKVQLEQQEQIEKIRRKANDADDMVDFDNSPSRSYGSPDSRKKKKKKGKRYDPNSSGADLLKNNNYSTGGGLDDVIGNGDVIFTNKKSPRRDSVEKEKNLIPMKNSN